MGSAGVFFAFGMDPGFVEPEAYITLGEGRVFGGKNMMPWQDRTCEHMMGLHRKVQGGVPKM